MADAQMKDLSQTNQNEQKLQHPCTQHIDNMRTPRINGAMLKGGQYQGKQIAIVGKYLGSDKNNNKISFEASDGRAFNVDIDVSQPFTGYNTKYIEIRGIVQNDGTLLQQAYQEFGNEFSMKTWDKLVILTHQFPNIF